MGFLDGIAGVGDFGNILGGIALHPSQQAALQQQPYVPRDMEAMLRKMGRMRPPRKVIKSRELSPRDRARKAINGAVQAVKDAQEKAK